jgi:hypothetical protein
MKYRSREKLVRICEFDKVSDADLAKLALDSAGVESVLMGETAGVSLYHVFDDYVKLMVFESDVEHAGQILSGKEEQQGTE